MLANQVPEDRLDALESAFVSAPEDDAALESYYRSIQQRGDYRRAERFLAAASLGFPQQRSIAFKLIDSLIRQGKHDRAIALIETAMVRFGLDDGFLDAALAVRRLAGTREPSGNHPSLSLCMMVKDEQEHLHVCLESVKSLVDEMVVVDTGSRDRTPDIAAIFGARVESFPWSGSFADCRNVALAKATCDWLLVLDADEALSPADCDAVRRAIAECPPATAFSVPIRNYSNRVNLLGWQANDGSCPGEERGKGWYPSQMIRLFPNHREIRFECPVHETVHPSLSRLGYQVVDLQGVVHHYGKLNESRDAVKHRFYFELGKKKLRSEPASPEAVAELAIQAAELGDYQEAVPLWETVLRMCPSWAEGHLNIGCCLEMAGGRYADALFHARRALQLKPELKEAVFNCAKYHLYLGDEDTSSELVASLLAREPGYPPVISLQCVLHILRGQPEQSAPLLARLKELGFDGRELLAQHARALAASGRAHQAQRVEAARAALPEG